MDRKLPWWLPETRVARTVCITVALVMVAGGTLLDAYVHERGVFWAGSAIGWAAGLLLVIGSWYRPRVQR